ncbi:MAG: hypothetical protein V4734_00710, partial [Terriglobus sp.]
MTTRITRWACAALAVAVLGLSPMHMFAQDAKPAPSTSKPQPQDEMDEFKPQPAPPLPAGMT